MRFNALCKGHPMVGPCLTTSTEGRSGQSVKILSVVAKTMRVMQLTAIFLLVTGLHVAASGLSQSISFRGRNVPLQEVFSVVKKQTGFLISYQKEQLKNAKSVTIDVKNVSLKDFLEQILEDQPLDFVIEENTVFVRKKITDPGVELKPTSGLFSPPIKISGIITGIRNQPLAGATIRVKGKSISAVSDDKGYFELTADQGSILIVSSIGFEQRDFKVMSALPVQIELLQAYSGLDTAEVLINTGYEQIPKERATGAFEIVTKEELNRRPGFDLLSRLEGVTTSIFFDKRSMTASQNAIPISNITIRGLSTLTSSISRPLIIVNNVPFEGDINNLNPNDVESLVILKDAAAASIYGARAGNGVIVITTKQGQLNQPVRVSFNTNIQMTSAPDLFKLPSMTSSEFIDAETFLFNNGFYNSDLSSARYPALSPVVELLYQRRAGLISPQDSATGIDALRRVDARNDFKDHVYRKSVAQQYYLNISGGGEKVKYSLGAGFDKTPGALVRNDYRRVTINLNNTYQPIKSLLLSVGIRYANSTSNDNSMGEIGARGYDYREGAKLMVPYAQFIDDDGNYTKMTKNYRLGYVDTAGGGKLLNWYYNPLQESSLYDIKTGYEDIVLNTGVVFKITPALEISGNYQYQNSNSSRHSNYSPETYLARNLINLYTNLNSNSPTIRNPVPIGGILDQNMIETTSQFARGQVSYNRLIGTKHQFNALAGGGMRQTRFTAFSRRIYGYSDSRLTSAVMDLITRFPLYGNRGTAVIPQGPFGLSGQLDRFVSLFANAAYTYDNRYTVTASARRDAANLVGVNINDLWKPFWSVGGAWNITHEKFFGSKWVSSLKLRATYGYQGNVNNTLSPYTILAYNAASTNSTFNLPFALISSPANPGLSWEKVKQTNAGLDVGLFNNRIYWSVDVYRKKGEDLILSASTDQTTGVTAINKNSASIATNGVDVVVESWNVKKQFSWKSQLMLSHVKSKILETLLDDDVEPTADGIIRSSGGGLSIGTREGFNPYSIYSYPFAGLDPSTGDPQGFLGKSISKDYEQIFNQKFDTANVVSHGSVIPTYFGNINNIFSYKGIELTVSISYKLNYYFRKQTINYYSLFQQGKQHPDYSKRWMKPGDEAYTTIPSMIYPMQNVRRDEFYALSSANVIKGDNIRLQYIRASYDISQHLMRRTPFRSVQLYSVVENIGLIWKANDEGLDPDYNFGNSVYLPPLRITAGLKLDF